MAWLSNHKKIVLTIVFPCISLLWKVVCDFLTTWMAFATWNTLFSHNFDVLNLMMKSDSSHFDCMVLKKQENIVHHIVFLLLCALKSDLWFSRINMDGIWNLKYTVFTQFWCAHPNMQRDLSGFDCRAPKSQEHIVFYSVFPWFFKNEITCDFL